MKEIEVLKSELLLLKQECNPSENDFVENNFE